MTPLDDKRINEIHAMVTDIRIQLARTQAQVSAGDHHQGDLHRGIDERVSRVEVEVNKVRDAIAARSWVAAILGAVASGITLAVGWLFMKGN